MHNDLLQNKIIQRMWIQSGWSVGIRSQDTHIKLWRGVWRNKNPFPMLYDQSRKIYLTQTGKYVIVVMRDRTEQRPHIFLARFGRLLHPAYQRHGLYSNLARYTVTLPG